MKNILYATVISLSATSAYAQDNCYSIEKITEVLFENFQEQPRTALTFAEPGGLMVFINPVTETWTLVTVNPNGIACAIGGGIGFLETAFGEQL